MAFIYEGCSDSPAQAAAVQPIRQMDRGLAAHLGRSAVAIAEEGRYRNPSGEWVDLAAHLDAGQRRRLSISAEAHLPQREAVAGSAAECRVSVRNETTLTAARRLAEDHGRVLVLNFANGVAPGGGFCDGARAQEENLCRSSTLYPTLVGDPMYDRHWARHDYESTHSAILSPRVAVFRDDAGNPLDEPWTMDVITCAAPVAHRVGQPRSGDLLAARIERVLDIAVAYGYDVLVLGAWGCGAFGNDRRRTAADFHAALRDRSAYFREVVFAITDWSADRRFLRPFHHEFDSAGIAIR